MRLKLLELPEKGLTWHWDVPASLMQEGSLGSVTPLAGLCSAVEWQGGISRRGDVFVLQGDWKMDVHRECSRCNAGFLLPMEGRSDRTFRVVGSAAELDESEEGDTLSPPGELDLLDVLREEIWLAWPQVVVCDSNCKGLCDRCGANLNLGECGCPKRGGDNPFAVLKGLKFD